jgi:hypothetical protein
MSTDIFAGLDYEELMAELGQRMSRISQEATCSSWHDRNNEELPQMCYEIIRRARPGALDTTLISVLEARLLVSLAEELGHWVTRLPGRRGWMPHIPKAMKQQASRTGHTAVIPLTAD